MDPLIDPTDPRRVRNRRPVRAFIRRVMRPESRPPKESDIFTAARHVTGAIGAGTSPAYEALAEGGAGRRGRESQPFAAEEPVASQHPRFAS